MTRQDYYGYILLLGIPNDKEKTYQLSTEMTQVFPQNASS